MDAAFGIRDRERCALPINSQRKPRRHQRSRKRGARTPEGVIYCGRPTIRGNPFRADCFGHVRSVRLYRRWIERKLTLPDLERLGFNQPEINALVDWRNRLDAELPRLRGHDLQCWCPLTTKYCHVEVLLEAANR
ncbi:DUF4326 domain-containing protein [Sphingobium sp. C100]|uniref:DUF4326 domain-containing protein n=1 Tax=Sphingobium sp. C100 TaxID=1207055 RepID=UPI000414846C|nr:DUF4326 domain-containing protein [Sphingobium sp. C100]